MPKISKALKASKAVQLFNALLAELVALKSTSHFSTAIKKNGIGFAVWGGASLAQFGELPTDAVVSKIESEEDHG